MDDIAGAAAVDIDQLRQLACAQPHGSQKILQQNLAGMNRQKIFFLHDSHPFLMIINKLNIMRLTITPNETNPKLPIDAYGILPLPISF